MIDPKRYRRTETPLSASQANRLIRAYDYFTFGINHAKDTYPLALIEGVKNADGKDVAPGDMIAFAKALNNLITGFEQALFGENFTDDIAFARNDEGIYEAKDHDDLRYADFGMINPAIRVPETYEELRDIMKKIKADLRSFPYNMKGNEALYKPFQKFIGHCEFLLDERTRSAGR